MNIMIFVPYLDYGGVSNYSIKCCEMLREEYENVYLVTFFDSREFKSNYINIFDSGNIFRKIYELRKFIKKKNIEKIITSIDLSPLILKIASIGIKIDLFSVFHVRPELYKLGSTSKVKNKIFDVILNFSFMVSKNVITVSKGLESDVKAKFKKFKDKVITIYNPIIKQLHEDEVKYVDIENKKNINILNVGWINDLKNQMEILQAINLLNDNRIHMTFVGGVKDEKYYEKLLEYIRKNKLKNITFTGEVNNVFDYFKESDIYVQASKAEALPTVLIEALENKVPIISNDCKFGPYEIIEDNQYGLLYDNSYQELSEKINLMIDNKKYNNFKIRSSIKAKEFSYESIKYSYLNLLNNSI